MQSNRRPLLAANWKLNLDWANIESYCETLRDELPRYFDESIDNPIDLLICPPLCYLGLLGALLEDSHVLSGAQLISTMSSGAFTGEVSAQMVADLGCDFAIVGHSERRMLFAEGEDQIALRLSQARENDLVPILCIGENLELRRAGQAVEHTLGQLESQLDELKKFEPGDIVIAYEPVWAIGTGENASPADAQAMAESIRGWVKQKLSNGHAAQQQILYGGSVKPDNIAEYFVLPDMDGALIGGASLDAAVMAQMLLICEGILAG
jgi:triosephosphate isomerase